MDQSDCVLCPTGTYQSNPGAQSQNDCTACALCVTGAHVASQCEIGSSEDTSTCSCNAGFIGTGRECTACGPGTYSAEGDQSCSECPAGTWSDTEAATDLSTCHNCPSDTYRGETGGTSPSDCAPCPENSGSQAGSNTREQCMCVSPYVGGFTASEGGCSLCPDNYYRDSVSKTCVHCPEKTFSPEGSFELQQCGATDYGTYVLYRSSTEVRLAIPDDEYDERTLMFFLKAMLGEDGVITVSSVEQM